MTISRTLINRDQQLESVRVATLEGSNHNLNGTYFNGDTNNGVGATLTNAGSLARLAIDSVELSNGDRILLVSQTSQYQNGIYNVIEQGSAAVRWVIKRSTDFQCAEQIRAGYFCSVEEGFVNAGAMFTVIRPVTGNIGVDPILFRAVDHDAQPQSSILARKFATNGGSATFTAPLTGATADAVAFANWETSTNAVSVQKVTPAADEITVLSSGDPGANSVISVLLFLETQ